MDENYKLRISFTFFENRHWSLKDHLLPASLRYKHSDDNEYTHSPIEVDAFNYQAEYLMDEKFTGKHKSIRDEVFDAMIISTGARGTYHLDKIENYGYPPLIVED